MVAVWTLHSGIIRGYLSLKHYLCMCRRLHVYRLTPYHLNRALPQYACEGELSKPLRHGCYTRYDRCRVAPYGYSNGHGKPFFVPFPHVPCTVPVLKPSHYGSIPVYGLHPVNTHIVGTTIWWSCQYKGPGDKWCNIPRPALDDGELSQVNLISCYNNILTGCLPHIPWCKTQQLLEEW